MSGEWIEFEGHRVYVGTGETKSSVLSRLELAKLHGLLLDVIAGLNSKAPTRSYPLAQHATPQSAPIGLKKATSKPGIEQNLLLYDIFLLAFCAKDWAELKNRYQRDDKGAVVLRLLDNDLAQEDDLRQAVEAVDAYALMIQRSAPDFVYTDYQFFAVLFTELFFRYHEIVLERARARSLSYPMLRLYSGSPPTDETELEAWLVAQLLPLNEKVKTKTGYAKSFLEKKDALLRDIQGGTRVASALSEHFNLTVVDDYLARLNRLALYMATGSGKTHLLHINLMQSETHLPKVMGFASGTRFNYYLIAPTGELAAQHARELRRFLPGKEIGFVEEGDEKTVTEATIRLLQSRAEICVLTTHQLAEVMKRIAGGFFGASNPFGETNVVFADEGHKGADKDVGWRDDRNRLMGEKGFCFEYSATFSQSIKDKTPLIQEYAKAIIFDYPYRLFYRDGYGKKPEFFPKESAVAIAQGLISGKMNDADKQVLTSNERWKLFVHQMVRFNEQVCVFRGHSDSPDYISHNFSSPLMLMMGNKVDDKEGASHVREVIALLDRFMRNDSNEAIVAIAAMGCSNAKETYGQIFHNIFHSSKPATLDVRRLNEKELGLRVSGTSRYFGAVYVGVVDSIGWRCEPDHLTGTLMEPFIETGDHPDVNFIVAARKLAEGWNTHRISSLGLVELGKVRGSLVVQLFGRGVRLAGRQENRLKRTGRYPVSERFDVYGYEAGYLRTFIDEAEAAEIIEERTLEVRIILKDDEPNNRKVLMPKELFGNSDKLVQLAADELFIKLAKRDQGKASGPVFRVDPRPFLDIKALYQHSQHQLAEGNFSISFEAFQACSGVALAEVALPQTARLGNLDLIQRWATGRMQTLLSAYYRHQAQAFEFEHAELAEISAESSRNLNFGSYRVSGPTHVIAPLERHLMRAGAILESAFHQESGDLAPVVRFDGEVLAVKSKPHLFEPLLVRLRNREDLRVSPDRLEESEFRFVSALHAYAHTNKMADLALLRNQKEWGFLGFYPDFVLWYRNKGLEHIAFIDPKGLTLHNTEDVVDKLYFSLALGGIDERVRQQNPNVRLSSFILLNNPVQGYLRDSSQRALLEVVMGRLLQTRLLGMNTTEPVAFTDTDLEGMLTALNTRVNDDDIASLLRAIESDDIITRRIKLTDQLRASLPKNVVTDLEEFHLSAVQAEEAGKLPSFLESRELSPDIPNVAVALLAHFILNHRHSRGDYEQLLRDISKKEWGQLNKAVSFSSAEALIDLTLEGASLVMPGVKIAASLAQILLRGLKKG